jgi:opacity protein-like surface antigen
MGLGDAARDHIIGVRAIPALEGTRDSRMRLLRLLGLSMLVLVASAVPARADLTAFVGAQTSPGTRAATGVSIGTGLLVLGFEFEYSQARGDDECVSRIALDCAPSVRTGMFNVLVQTPRGVIPRTQLYVTAGGGFFRERFDPLDVQETGVGSNVGGGAKIELVGPLRVRVDYRVFKFGGDSIYQKPQRFSVGLNLAF